MILLDNKTKLLLQTHDIHELQEWSTGTGRNLDGLKLEFRGSKPWSLVAPSCERLKSITGALLDVMGTENRLFDCLLFHQNPLYCMLTLYSGSTLILCTKHRFLLCDSRARSHCYLSPRCHIAVFFLRIKAYRHKEYAINCKYTHICIGY